MASEPESTAQKRPFDALEDGSSSALEANLDPAMENPVDHSMEHEMDHTMDTSMDSTLETTLDPALEPGLEQTETATPVTPSSDIKPKKKKSSSQQRRLEPFREGKQASVAQIRDLRLLTRFVKDFEIKIKQHEIDDYLGFSSRTSRRLRNGGPTKSELVAEGKLERHPRADNWKNGKEKKRKLALESGTQQHDLELELGPEHEPEPDDTPTVDPQLQNPIPLDGPDFANGGYRDSYDLMNATDTNPNVQAMG